MSKPVKITDPEIIDQYLSRYYTLSEKSIEVLTDVQLSIAVEQIVTWAKSRGTQIDLYSLRDQLPRWINEKTAAVPKMTDDEMFALANRIMSIESAMVTLQRVVPNTTACYRDQEYGLLLELRRQLDEQLGFKADEEQIGFCQGCGASSDDEVVILSRRSAICTACLAKIPSKVSKAIASMLGKVVAAVP